MIELRWFKRVKVVPSMESPIATEVLAERVLQYRIGIYPFREPHEKDWQGTAWLDVPTVTEAK